MNGLNVNMMQDAERIQLASKLSLRAIADEGLLCRGMWMEYTGANYSVKSTTYFRCKKCKRHKLRNLNNFSMDRCAKDFMKTICKDCDNIRHAGYRQRIKKERTMDQLY